MKRLWLLLLVMNVIWRWVEEEGGGVVLWDHWEAGWRFPASRKRSSRPPPCFQVKRFPVYSSKSKFNLTKSPPRWASVHSRWRYDSDKLLIWGFWLSAMQLWWSFSEGKHQLPNGEGSVTAAPLLRVWRYAWLLESINNISTKCDSGWRDYCGAHWPYFV